MDILHLMQWDGICHVLLNYCTCFQSTIWMSGTLFVMILQTCTGCIKKKVIELQRAIIRELLGV